MKNINSNTPKNADEKKKNWSNTVLIIISFVIAIVIWFSATQMNQTQIKRIFSNVELTIRNTDALERKSLTIVNVESTTVDVTLKGYYSDLKNISSDELSATVDVSSISEAGTYQLTPALGGYSNDVSVAGTDTVEVVVERIATKGITANIEVVGTPREGYAFVEELTEYNPEINIQAPKSVADAVTGAKLVLDVTDKASTFNATLNVIFLDSAGNEISNSSITSDVESINVKAVIYRQVTVPVIYDGYIVGSPASGYRVVSTSILPSEVTVLCEETQEAQIRDGIPIEMVDIDGMTEDYQAVVALQLPEGVLMASGQGDNVSLVVDIEQIITRRVTVTQFEFFNLPEGMTAMPASGQSITVTITGAQSEIENLTEGSVLLFVDLSEASEGTNRYNITETQLLGVSNADTYLSRDWISVTVETQ